MRKVTSIAGATIAVATVGALLAPTAGAATMNHRHWDKGTLRVCTVGNEREADIDVDGPSDRDADLDSRECASWTLKKGTYEVSQDENKYNNVSRTIVRGPGRNWDASRDNEVDVQVRGGMTTTVIFINSDRDHERWHHDFGQCHWCGDSD
jgi:hypothetical protein